jgi:hypothetical protein
VGGPHRCNDQLRGTTGFHANDVRSADRERNIRPVVDRDGTPRFDTNTDGKPYLHPDLDPDAHTDRHHDQHATGDANPDADPVRAVVRVPACRGVAAAVPHVVGAEL